MCELRLKPSRFKQKRQRKIAGEKNPRGMKQVKKKQVNHIKT